MCISTFHSFWHVHIHISFILTCAYPHFIHSDMCISTFHSFWHALSPISFILTCAYPHFIHSDMHLAPFHSFWHAHIHILCILKQLTLLANHFIRKSIPRHYHVFKFCKFQAKAYGWNDGSQKADSEKTCELQFQAQATIIMLLSPKPKNKTDANYGTASSKQQQPGDESDCWIWVDASPNHRSVMKAEHGSLITQAHNKPRTFNS